MNNFLEKARQWAPTVVIVGALAISLVRMHTAQALLIKQVEKKVALDVYQTDRKYLIRELNHIQAGLIKIESKIDNAIATSKNNPGTGRN